MSFRASSGRAPCRGEEKSFGLFIAHFAPSKRFLLAPNAQPLPLVRNDISFNSLVIIRHFGQEANFCYCLIKYNLDYVSQAILAVNLDVSDAFIVLNFFYSF